MARITRRSFIFGCSHASGAELWVGLQPEVVGHPHEDYGLAHSYPTQISRALGYEPCNHALGGGSNDMIFRAWAQVQHDVTKDDLVLACWTGPDRTEIWHAQDQLWLPITPGTQRYFKRVPDDLHLQGRTIWESVTDHARVLEYAKLWMTFSHEHAAKLNKIKNILALNTWAQQREVKVINIDSFAPVDRMTVGKCVWPSTENFWDWSLANGFVPTADGHFGLDAHSAFAQLILDAYHG